MKKYCRAWTWRVFWEENKASRNYVWLKLESPWMIPSDQCHVCLLALQHDLVAGRLSWAGHLSSLPGKAAFRARGGKEKWLGKFANC